MFIRDVLMLKNSDDLSCRLFGLNHILFIKDGAGKQIAALPGSFDGVVASRQFAWR